MAGLHLRGPRYLVDEHLRVPPELIGQPLASPFRRLLAFVIDWVIVAVPTLLLATGAVLLFLRLNEPGVLTALGFWDSPNAQVRQRARKDLAPFLVRVEAPGLPAAAKAAVEEGDLDRAAALLEGYSITFNLDLGPRSETKLQPRWIRVDLTEVIPKTTRFLVLYGLSALYFILFWASARGATPGKRLLGIRVVPVAGGHLTRLQALERFVGYVHIPATLGLTCLDLWHDPNRRMSHDRASESVVLRVPRAAPLRDKP